MSTFANSYPHIVIGKFVATRFLESNSDVFTEVSRCHYRFCRKFPNLLLLYFGT